MLLLYIALKQLSSVLILWVGLWVMGWLLVFPLVGLLVLVFLMESMKEEARDAHMLLQDPLSIESTTTNFDPNNCFGFFFLLSICLP